MDPLFSFDFEKVGLALSGRGHFRPCDITSIANCASTLVKLICTDIISQHDREFDQKLS
jgi:hypothetical protein